MNEDVFICGRCADTLVRTRAVEWLSAMSDDALMDHMPQLVQALKFESYHTSALARLLVQRCLLSARLAHQICW